MSLIKAKRNKIRNKIKKLLNRPVGPLPADVERVVENILSGKEDWKVLKAQFRKEISR